MNVESRNAATDPSIARFREDSRRVKILEKISSLEPTNDDDGVEKLELWLLAPTLFFLFERGGGRGEGEIRRGRNVRCNQSYPQFPQSNKRDVYSFLDRSSNDLT